MSEDSDLKLTTLPSYQTESGNSDETVIQPESAIDNRDIVWFDIDNTLYSASTRIADAMGQRIHDYFLSLGLSEEEASSLRHKYYREYGLALRGLVRHHDVDALDFDKRCDGSLPLEEMIVPDPTVRKLLQDIDRRKVRICALTNAYVTHARRVLKTLQLEDLIEKVIYCDYANPNFCCKPEAQFFHEALTRAGVTDPSKCYFVDDSLTNVLAAVRLGWGHCVHFSEKSTSADINTDANNQDGRSYTVISSLEQLREIWPRTFNERAALSTTTP